MDESAEQLTALGSGLHPGRVAAIYRALVTHPPPDGRPLTSSFFVNVLEGSDRKTAPAVLYALGVTDGEARLLPWIQRALASRQQPGQLYRATRDRFVQRYPEVGRLREDPVGLRRWLVSKGLDEGAASDAARFLQQLMRLEERRQRGTRYQRPETADSAIMASTNLSSTPAAQDPLVQQLIYRVPDPDDPNFPVWQRAIAALMAFVNAGSRRGAPGEHA